MPDIKNTVTEMKNDFDQLTGDQQTVKERISEPEDMSTETSQTEIQRENGMGKKWNRIAKNSGAVIEGVTRIVGLRRRRRKRKQKKYLK